MNDQSRRDNELADFTDQLLAGQAADGHDDMQDLAAVVQRLHQLVGPDNAPSATFQARLTQRLEMEWSLTQQRKTQWWRNRRMQRFSALLAASVAMVVAAVAFLTLYETESNDTLQGSAVGPATCVVVVALISVAVVSLFLFFRRYQG